MNGIQMFPAIARRLATVMFLVLLVGCADESVDTPAPISAPTADAGSSEPTTPSTTDAGSNNMVEDSILTHEECMENAACGDFTCAPAELYAELVAEIKAISEAPSVQQDETEDGTVFCTDPCEGLYGVHGTWTCERSAIVHESVEALPLWGECYFQVTDFGEYAPGAYTYDPTTDELGIQKGDGNGYLSCYRS